MGGDFSLLERNFLLKISEVNTTLKKRFYNRASEIAVIIIFKIKYHSFGI